MTIFFVLFAVIEPSTHVTVCAFNVQPLGKILSRTVYEEGMASETITFCAVTDEIFFTVIA